MEKEKKIFGVTKNVFNLSLVSFFTDVSSEMIYPLLPVFLTVVLKAPIAFVGVVEGVAESTASVLKLIFGHVSDKLNKRKIFVSCGYTLSSIIRPMIAFAVYPWQVLFVRFADRVGKGVRTAPRDALIADTCDPEEKGRAFGFNRAADHAGAVMGPLIAFILLTYFTKDYRLIFALAFIPALIAVYIVIFLVREKKLKIECVGTGRDLSLLKGLTPQNLQNPTGSGTAPPVAGRVPDPMHRRVLQFLRYQTQLFDKNFKIYLVIIFIFTLGNSSDAFLILRAKDLGVPVSFIPILWVAFHLVKMASSTPGGVLSDKFGRKKVIVAGWCIYFLVYLGFAFAKTPFHIWILFMIYGFFFGLTEAAEKAFVADLVSSDKRGSAYGVYNFAIGIGALPASVIMGVLWQKFGVITAFSFGAGLAALAAVLLATLIVPFRGQNVNNLLTKS